MIEMTKASPDIETLKLVVYIAGVLIVFLVGIIGYMAKRKDTEVSSQIDKINYLVDSLTKNVNEVTKLAEVIRVQ